MKAYQFNSPETGLELVDIDAPRPGPGQVLIDVDVAGMCQSDVHIVNGHGDDWLRKRPIVLGHEVAGTVRGLGPDVTGVQVGDRVAIALISHPIEHADFAHAIGLGFDGGYARQALAPVANLVPIPAGVSFAHAAVATDSVATAYHAVVTEAAIETGMIVAIVGLGGLGLNGVRIAALQQATVYGVDIDRTVFDDARAQGAVDCFTTVDDVPVALDAVIDFAGVGMTTADAVTVVKPGGRVVLVGLGAPEATIPTHQLVTKNIQLRGSIGASIGELEAVLALIAEGNLTPVLEEVDFGDLPAALTRLQAGAVRGRLVTRPDA